MRRGILERRGFYGLIGCLVFKVNFLR
ncbi:hypothetical protein [Thermanaeromonas toyohensis]